MQIAVPVSWHVGNSPAAATTWFISIVCATNLSLSLASGSFKMSASFCRCDARRKNDTSAYASRASNSNPSFSIFNIFLPSHSTVFTYSFVNRRYSVVSPSNGNGSWYLNSAISYYDLKFLFANVNRINENAEYFMEIFL